MLELDPVLFEQALFNLLDNAAKYAPIGTAVRIQSWRDRDSVGLMVLDEGDGIPPDDLEQIHIFVLHNCCVSFAGPTPLYHGKYRRFHEII